MENEPTTYQYSPLVSQPVFSTRLFTTRLLHLLPSTDKTAALRCHLIETEIPDGVSESVEDCGDFLHRRSEFQALSYTWGAQIFPRTLEVLRHNKDGEPPSTGIIKITENLHSALHHLRLRDSTLILWVDAVCINQADIPERNSQVSNIPRIYAEASSVIVWLGSETSDGHGRLSLLFFKELARLASLKSASGHVEERNSWRHRCHVNDLISMFMCNETALKAIALFLERPWFRRRWIVQEVVLAKEVILHCGNLSMSWDIFENGLIELSDNGIGAFNSDHRTTMRSMTLMRHADVGAKRQLPLDVLVEFSSFLCANPKDRLYALFGVIQHWFPGSDNQRLHSQTGTVDYALPTEEVFTEFATLMMRLNKNLPAETYYNCVTHVLQLAAAFRQRCRPDLTERSGTRSGKLPSWVVDWTETLSFQPLGHSPVHQDASFGIPRREVQILMPKDGVRRLLVTGIAYDIITTELPINLALGLLVDGAHEARRAVNNVILEIIRMMRETHFPCGPDRNTHTPTGQHIMTAIATSIVANWEHTPANSYFAQHPRFRVDFLEQLASDKYYLCEMLHKWPAYIDLVRITMRGRNLFLTARGHVGIGASHVQKGDVICVLSDIRVPFVLRPLGDRPSPTMKDGVADLPGCLGFQNEDEYAEAISKLTDNPREHATFTLIGDAYVHGLMNGEGTQKLGSRLSESLKVFPIE